MKRFTETQKWTDPWFRRLSERAKLLWEYLTDNCSCIGLIELDLDLASFQIGGQVTEEHVKELGDRVLALGNGKLFLPKFIHFQYGEISETCPAHKPIIRMITQHGLIKADSHYQYPSDRVPVGIQIPTGKERKGKGTGKERKEGVQGEKGYHPDSRAALHILNEASGRHFRETDVNLKIISARLSEPEVTIDGVRLMITRQCKRWKGTDMAEYLRPETLFGKTKFDGYYAAKDEPVNGQNRPAESGQLQEQINLKSL